MRNTATEVGQLLLNTGFAVKDDYLPWSRLRSLAECAALRRSRGEFREARVGTFARGRQCSAIRGDSICWIEPPLLEAEKDLFDEVEQLRLALNRDGLLGLFDVELHYAWYPPGARYVRHLDQLQGREQRVVSWILYLNRDWSAEAGGELRLWVGDAVRDVAPVAGRLVCFFSATVEHEVLTTSRDRFSVSGWLRRRAS